MTNEELVARTIRFYDRYSDELDSIRQLLEIRLKQIALAYTLEHGLPKESVQIFSRTKSLKSFLKKLEKKGYPDYYLPTEIITDLIGAKIVCWFLDDCYGVLELIQNSKHFIIKTDSIDDYIEKPKDSGYRSIHLLTEIEYDRISKKSEGRELISDNFICEVQIRTKLQEAWGEFTHEMHYKVPGGIKRDEYNVLVSAISDRLYTEDKSAVAIRNILQVDPKLDKHEGIRD